MIYYEYISIATHLNFYYLPTNRIYIHNFYFSQYHIQNNITKTTNHIISI